MLVFRILKELSNNEGQFFKIVNSLYETIELFKYNFE